MNKLRYARASLFLLVPALALATACSSGDDDDNNNNGTDAGPGSNTDASTNAPDGSPIGTQDSGTTPDGSTGTPDSGGRITVTSTCTAANVTYGVQVPTLLANETNFDNVLSGYFDKDTKEDVLVLVGASGADTLQVLLSKGDGTFAAPQVTTQKYDSSGESGESTVVYDVDGDGLDDVIVGSVDNSENEALALLISKGDGTFKAPVYIPWGDNSTGLLQLLSADFNGDKIPDLFYTSETSGSAVLLGTAAHGFSAGTAVTVGGDWVTAGDVNGDGVADLVTNAKDADTPGPCVYLNNGSGSFGTTPTCATPSSGIGGFDYVNIADVNKDGKPDLVATAAMAADSSNPNINVFLGTGAGAFGQATPYALDVDLRAVKVIDVNNDGFPDYVGNDQSNVDSQLDILLNDGTGKFATTKVSYGFGTENAFAYSPFAAGDFAGNGLVGFAGISYTSNTVPQLETIVTTCKQ